MAVEIPQLVDRKDLVKNAALVLAGQLYHYKWIAKAVGLNEDTLKLYRDEDPVFSDKLERERAGFIAKNMKKAKPEFLLQTADRNTFGEQKKIVVEDAMDKLLEAYGITENGKLIEEGGNDRQIDEPVSGASQEKA